ncbi:reverse transcriptase [Elysia marginata]|uniref:Reverse transcriptase n=1 Tax=Elysia marginata TaxID=1093978 RepID=A0AAV4JCI1_9GAST|nr:reverse transcriptase [Elysia marginata]
MPHFTKILHGCGNYFVIIPRTTESGAETWHGRPSTTSTQRKWLLESCDGWVVSTCLPEVGRHSDAIRRTILRLDIVIYSCSTQQFIVLELAVPYESRIEDAHTQRGNIPGLD